MRLTIAIACALLSAACATAPPSQYDVRNTRDYPVRQDVAWVRAMSVVTGNGMYVTAADKANGVISAERSVLAPDRGGAVFDWADCGAVSALERPVSQLADISIHVEAVPGGSRIAISPRFSELRQNVNRGVRRVSCTSTGTLEYRLLHAFSLE